MEPDFIIACIKRHSRPADSLSYSDEEDELPNQAPSTKLVQDQSRTESSAIPQLIKPDNCDSVFEENQPGRGRVDEHSRRNAPVRNSSNDDDDVFKPAPGTSPDAISGNDRVAMADAFPGADRNDLGISTESKDGVASNVTTSAPSENQIAHQFDPSPCGEASHPTATDGFGAKTPEKNLSKHLFLIKWKSCAEADLVDSREANLKCPQLVIQFFEKKLKFLDQPTSDERSEEDRPDDKDYRDDGGDGVIKERADSEKGDGVGDH